MAAGERADAEFMQRALELAARGLGRTSPNPAVGAVVVADGLKDGDRTYFRVAAIDADGSRGGPSDYVY